MRSQLAEFAKRWDALHGEDVLNYMQVELTFKGKNRDAAPKTMPLFPYFVCYRLYRLRESHVYGCVEIRTLTKSSIRYPLDVFTIQLCFT